MKLSTKLYIGAGVLSLFIAGLVFFNIQKMTLMTRIFEVNSTVGQVKENIGKIQDAVNDFHVNIMNGKFDETADQIVKETEKYSSMIDAELQAVLDRTNDSTAYSEIQKLKEGVKSFSNIVNQNAGLDEQNAKNKVEIIKVSTSVKDKIDHKLHDFHSTVHDSKDLDVAYSNILAIVHAREHVHNVINVQKTAIETANEELFETIQKNGKHFIKKFTEIADSQSDNKHKVDLLKIVDDAKAYMSLFNGTEQNVKSINKELIKLGEVNKQIDKAVSTLSTYCSNLSKQVAEQSMHIATVASIIFIIALLLASLIAVRSITKPILNITEVLQNLSEHIAGSSIEIQSASESLASSATEQSSAVTETSASVEELDGMVKNNLDNAEKSLEVADRTMEMVNVGNDLVNQLQEATKVMMEGNAKIEGLVNVISAIGDKTKIIDEIVFQTKLLSFNASVEAERAGEHGRGFAVVAQEVGNLAKLSGTAALEISDIVKSSIEQATELTKANNEKFARGAEIVEKVASMFNDIKDETETVKMGSHGVKGACEEQALGIDQINVAISEIDKATQAISSAAEQNSGSSKKLKDIAVSMKDSVNSLAKVILGNADLSQEQVKAKKKEVKKTFVATTSKTKKVEVKKSLPKKEEKKVEVKKVEKKPIEHKKVEVKKAEPKKVEDKKKVEVKKTPTVETAHKEPTAEDFVVLQNNTVQAPVDTVPLTDNDKSWDEL